MAGDILKEGLKCQSDRFVLKKSKDGFIRYE